VTHFDEKNGSNSKNKTKKAWIPFLFYRPSLVLAQVPSMQNKRLNLAQFWLDFGSTL